MTRTTEPAVRVVVIQKLRTREKYIWIWEDTDLNRAEILRRCIRWSCSDELSWSLKDSNGLMHIVLADED